MGADRHFQRVTRLVILALRSVEHREVVVRFGQFRIILRQLGEHADGIVGLVLFGEQNAAEKAAACIFRAGFQILIDAFQRAVGLSLFQQLLGFLQFVGLRQGRNDKPHA